jgi:hypothetical protein
MKNIFTAAALIAVIPLAMHAADDPDSILKLLGDAQAQSSQLSLEWKSYARQPAIDWSGDAAEVTAMKDKLTAVARTVAALNDTRPQASFAQLTAMDRIVPVVQEIADNTTKAIGFLAKNQTRLTGKQYRDYIEQNSDTSNRLATLVSQLVDYETRKARFDAARRDLEFVEK